MIKFLEKMLYFHIKNSDDKLSVEIVKAFVEGDKLVHIQNRKLYLEDIQKNFPPLIADFIIKEQVKAIKSKGILTSKNIIEMNRLFFSDFVLIRLLEILQGYGKIFFDYRKLKINKEKVKFLFKCKKLNETLQVEPFLNLKSLIDLKECAFFNSHFVIFKNEIFLFKNELEKNWTRLFKQSEIFLAKRDLKYFLEDFENQLIFKKAEKKCLEPLLILCDPAGISARLKFKYDEGVFEAYSKLKDHLRDYEMEKVFIKDLLEVGYQSKDDQSIFFCPQPKVFEALNLLIEIGWKVLNYQNKAVVLETASQIEIEKNDMSLQLKAQILLDNNEIIETNEIFQLCLKGQNFLAVGNKIALIDSIKYQQKFKSFISEKTASLPLAKVAFINNLDDQMESTLLSLKNILMKKKDFPSVLPSKDFLGNLFDYQKIGLNFLAFLYENRLGAFLADEMGLGKTVQILAFFSRLRNFCPVLIIAPKSLISNWKSEFKRFLPDADLKEYYGPNRSIDFSLNSFIITTYGTLNKDWEKLSRQKFECIVMDESSFIKNNKTKTFQAVTSLLAYFKICLNGTPIENNLEELISQFNCLIPNLINSKMSDKQIKNLINPFFLQRTKESVEIDLPPKQEQLVYVEMNEAQQIEYDKMLTKARSAFKTKEDFKANKMHVFETLLRLRQICCDPTLVEGNNAPSAKLERLLLDIESVASKRKVLIFSQFTSMLKKIKSKLKNYKTLYLDGQTSLKERAQMVESFQADNEAYIFLISLKAAGYGLNLHSADYVLIFDPWWNDAVEKQAIDRAHRIGRSRSLIAKKYLTINTIEEKIYHLKINKLKTSELFIPQNLSTDDLYDLLY